MLPALLLRHVCTRYGTAVDMACADDVLTKGEKDFLEKQRVELGITEEEHRTEFASRLANLATETVPAAQSQQLEAKLDRLLDLQQEANVRQQEAMDVLYNMQDNQRAILGEVEACTRRSSRGLLARSRPRA